MESFDKDLPTYVVVHGWKSSTASDTVQVNSAHSNGIKRTHDKNDEPSFRCLLFSFIITSTPCVEIDARLMHKLSLFH